MHRHRQASRQANGDVARRCVQRRIAEAAMVIHEGDGNRARAGFHLRALTQVVKLNAAASGRNLHSPVGTGQAHAAATGISTHRTAHVAEEEIAAFGSGTQVAIALAHFDPAAAAGDG